MLKSNARWVPNVLKIMFEFKGGFNLTEGFIDSATLYEMTTITRENNPEKCSDWTWSCGIKATTALINLHTIKIAPAPHKSRAASGVYDYLMIGLSNIVDIIKPEDRLIQDAIEETKLLVQNNTEYVEKAFQYVCNYKSYNQWMQDGIHYSWSEHAMRLDGLFNKVFIDQISLIMKVDSNNLEEAWKLSCNNEYLNKVSKEKIVDEEIKVIKGAYTISALLRGYFYAIYAKKAKIHFIHHPFRSPILQTSDKRNESIQEFQISNVQRYLTIIILSGALSGGSQKEKMNIWLENISKARKGISFYNLEQVNSESIALNNAIKIAKELDIRTSPKWIDITIEILIGLGFNVMTSFILQGWDGFVVGLASSVLLSDKIKIGERLNLRFSNTDNHLKELANARPGRIEEIWWE